MEAVHTVFTVMTTQEKVDLLPCDISAPHRDARMQGSDESSKSKRHGGKPCPCVSMQIPDFPEGPCRWVWFSPLSVSHAPPG